MQVSAHRNGFLGPAAGNRFNVEDRATLPVIWSLLTRRSYDNSAGLAGMPRITALG